MVAAVAVVLVGAALLVWLLFDPNDYKDELSALVQARTGRTFVIEDDLSLTFFPWLGVQTGGVRLGSAGRAGDETFAGAAGVTVRVRLLPLLSRRLEIGTIELDGLELNLARDAAGRGNWEDLVASDSADPAPAAAATGPTVQALDIAGIRIRDGVIFWRDNLTEVRYVLSELSLDTGPVALGEPVQAALDFRLLSVDPPLTASLAARTTALIDPTTPHYRADDIRLEFRIEDGQHDQRAAGQLRANLEYAAQDGTIRMSAAAVQADLTDPPGGPETLSLRAAAEEARLELEAQTAEVRGLTTTIGDIVARWEVSAADLLDGPRLTGTVRIAEASLDDALAMAGVTLQTQAPLGHFDLSSRFTLDSVTGSLALAGLEAAALGLTVDGELSVTEAGTTGRFAAPAFDPASLIGLLPPETLAGVDVSGVESLTLSASFSISATQPVLSLQDFTATIPGATFTGALDRLEDGQRLRGRITTTELAPDLVLRLLPGRLPEGLGPEQLGPVSLDTRFDYSAGADSLQLRGLAAQALGLRATGDVVVQPLTDAPRVTGGVAIQAFSPRALLDRFDHAAPATSDSTALGAATISAAVDVSAERAQLEEIRMRLDDTTVTGRFAVEDFAEPRYLFDLALDRLAVDRYLPLPGDAPAGGSPAGERPLPTAPLDTLALSGRLAVADLRMAGLSFSDVSTRVSVADDIGRVEEARGRLYGGEFEGNAVLDARAGRPVLDLRGSALTLDVAALMTALSGQPTLSGTGSFEFELSGTGANLDDVLATTAGYLDFSLGEGAIRGFNLDHTLCDTFNRLKQVPRPAPADEPFTAFNLLRGTTQVSEGIARTSDLTARTPSLEVTGRGQMDLVSRQLNYDLEAALTDRIAISGCSTLDSAVGDSVPFEVSGTLAEPRVLPDFGELLRREVRDELQERLLERLLGN